MAKILFIIAHKNYQDNELSDIKKELEENKIEIASSEKTPAKGALGGSCEIDLTTTEALEKINNYDALVLIGGGGTEQYFQDNIVHEIIKKMEEKEKLIAAICLAPKVLALAGILQGKKATVWDLGDQSIIKDIETKGTIYSEEDITVDSNILTANGPHVAKEFGQLIKKKLEEEKC